MAKSTTATLMQIKVKKSTRARNANERGSEAEIEI